jgi:hypothetical protein
MIIITGILLTSAILKLTAILNAIRWLLNHGRNYRDKYLNKQLPSTRAQYYRALKRCQGKFFPFGFKDFELHRYIEKTGRYRGLQHICLPLARLSQAVLLRFNRLTLVATIYLLISSDLIGIKWFDWPLTGEQHLDVSIILVLIILITNIFLSVEAIHSYAILGSYAISFHLLSPERDRWSGGTLILVELKVFVQRVVSTICAGSIACYVTHLQFRVLTGSIVEPTAFDLLNRLKILLQCIYFTVTTFATVGYGDIQPKNGLGQLVAFLIIAQSFALVIIVFASLLSSRQQETNYLEDNTSSARHNKSFDPTLR